MLFWLHMCWYRVSMMPCKAFSQNPNACSGNAFLTHSEKYRSMPIHAVPPVETRHNSNDIRQRESTVHMFFVFFNTVCNIMQLKAWKCWDDELVFMSTFKTVISVSVHLNPHKERNENQAWWWIEKVMAKTEIQFVFYTTVTLTVAMVTRSQIFLKLIGFNCWGDKSLKSIKQHPRNK